MQNPYQTTRSRLSIRLKELDQRILEIRDVLVTLSTQREELEVTIKFVSAKSSQLSQDLFRLENEQKEVRERLAALSPHRPKGKAREDPAQSERVKDVVRRKSQADKEKRKKMTPISKLSMIAREQNLPASLLLVTLDHGSFEKDLYQEIQFEGIVSKDIVIYSESKPPDVRFHGRTVGKDLFFEEDENAAFMLYQFFVSLNVFVAAFMSVEASILVASWHTSAEEIADEDKPDYSHGVLMAYYIVVFLLEQNTRDQIQAALDDQRAEIAMERSLLRLRTGRGTSIKKKKTRSKQELDELYALTSRIFTLLDEESLYVMKEAFETWVQEEDYAMDYFYSHLMTFVADLDQYGKDFIRWLSTLDSISNIVDYDNYVATLDTVKKQFYEFDRSKEGEDEDEIQMAFDAFGSTINQMASMAQFARDAFTVYKLYRIVLKSDYKKILLLVGSAHEERLREGFERVFSTMWKIVPSDPRFDLPSFLGTLLIFTNTPPPSMEPIPGPSFVETSARKEKVRQTLVQLF